MKTFWRFEFKASNLPKCTKATAWSAGEEGNKKEQVGTEVVIDLLPMFGPDVLLITPFRFFEVQQRIVDVGLTSLAFFAEFDLSLPINLGDLDPVLVRLTIRTPEVGQRTACTLGS